MPELPDLTAYIEALAARLAGARFEGLRVVQPFVLRSVAPAAEELAGRALLGLRRLGKRIVFALEGDSFLVLHLMVAGRLQFEPAGAPGGRAASRNRIAELSFSSGTVVFTEAGKRRRASLHLVQGEAALAAHDPGGIEPMGADLAAFRTALGTGNHTLKRALTDPHLVAGIGNAYSDEILHAARLSPFARTGALTDDAWQRLHAATLATLQTWTDRLRRELAGRFPDKVTAFRPEMAVHGRFREPCPVCATPVQRIVYAGSEANYCPVCQTGGRLLADRLLSRLLHDDWPKSVEELEEKKGRARAAADGVGALVLVLALLGGAAAQGDGAPPNEPPLGRAVVPPLPLPARSPDPVRLAAARAILDAPSGLLPAGPRQLDRRLGGYLLLTDIDAPALLERAGRLVGSVERLYFERYGRRPVGFPLEAIVLFSAEADYRAFQAGDARLAGLTGSTGLTAQGIVATYRGGRTDDELLGTLVHELGHLLNRRALGPSLPPWLDEGICDDLGASRVDPEGNLLPGTWSRNLDVRAGQIRISGGEAALRDLAGLYGPDGSAPVRLDLESMLALEWEAFVAPASAELHYAAAAAFIRMLLAAPAKEPHFRDWLVGVSAGASPAAEELRQALGRPWDELDRELALWTRFELGRLPPLGP